MLPASFVTEISAYATAVTAIATMVLAYLTYRLAWESRNLRKAGDQPRIVAYLAPHPDGHGGVNFVLANYGLGPAFEVSFQFKHDPADFNDHDVMLKNETARTAFTVIPPGEKIAALFGVGYVLFAGGKLSGESLKPFVVAVKYTDIEKRILSSEFTLDIRQFDGLPGLANKPPILSISQSIEKIERHISALGGSHGLIAQLVDSTKLSDSHRNVTKGNPEGEG